jgi:hypothetical protein
MLLLFLGSRKIGRSQTVGLDPFLGHLLHKTKQSYLYFTVRQFLIFLKFVYVVFLIIKRTLITTLLMIFPHFTQILQR